MCIHNSPFFLHPIVQYLFMSEGESGPTTSVEFMSPKDLEYFLNHRKSRPDGILQQFLPTADCNAQIQVIWSPRVTLIQRRVNKNRLGDRNIPAYRRAVTYDGPTYHSEEGLCSGRTKNQILEVCHSIVEHFSSTEHKVISRFVVYFKVSPVPKQAAAGGHDTLWLLWASSLRIGDQNKYKPSISGNNFRPLNLSPNISSEIAAGDRAEAQPIEASRLIREKLHEADQRQLSLSCDVLFSKTIGVTRSPRIPQGRSARKPQEGKSFTSRTSQVKRGKDGRAQTPQPTGSTWNSAGPSPPNGYSPTPPPLKLGTKQIMSLKDVTGGSRKASRVRMKNDDKSGASSKHLPAHREGDVQQNAEWWTVSPDIKEKYDDIQEEARQVTQYVDDVVYSLYSHLLRKNSSPFFISIPPYIKSFFVDVGMDKLALLLSGVIRMSKYQPKQANPGLSEDSVPPEFLDQSDVWYIVSDKVPPFGMQVSEVTEVIRKLVLIKLDDIKKICIRERNVPAPSKRIAHGPA